MEILASKFPIFPISKEEQPIGQLLLGKEEKNLDWNYYITYIDEFIQRKLIAEELREEFENNYKNPDEFCCLFVMDGAFTSFVYIPYPNDWLQKGFSIELAKAFFMT